MSTLPFSSEYNSCTHTNSYHADDKVLGNSTLQVLDTSPSFFLNDGVTFLNDYGDSAKGET
jgi:hypothetical protein